MHAITADSRESLGLCILGATGSIGQSTLEVVSRHPRRFHVQSLTAHRNVARMQELCLRHRPRQAVMADPKAADELAERLARAGGATEVLAGAEALAQVAADPASPLVMAAIVGGAGLLPTLAAARGGKRVLLANKESLVMGGSVLMAEVAAHGATLLPIDSEHNAVFQCLPADYRGAGEAGVQRILLTASGGPFLDTPLAALERVTPQQACAHPNWDMGRKISVDSATMMNKGLEVIEACWLFAIEDHQVEVVIHPQSVVHSMVAYSDGSVLAQLGNPDMRTPIAHAMAWPRRIDSGVSALDLTAVARLDFRRPDLARFPCLDLAYQALRRGGSASLVLNAANEIAVAGFLDGNLRFTDIPRVIESTLSQAPIGMPATVEELLLADRAAREVAAEAASGCARRLR